jgi:hypothetical protein
LKDLIKNLKLLEQTAEPSWLEGKIEIDGQRFTDSLVEQVDEPVGTGKIE